MFRRGISTEDVRHVVRIGEPIEDYPEDTPYPSRLVLGWRGSRPLHIAIADDADAQKTIAITVLSLIHI